uniref:Uncharacterized protein n=1 Tax=Parascaris equorum TaxID=6256 RepID=A0A914RTZ8_PAREQ
MTGGTDDASEIFDGYVGMREVKRPSGAMNLIWRLLVGHESASAYPIKGVVALTSQEVESSVGTRCLLVAFVVRFSIGGTPLMQIISAPHCHCCACCAFALAHFVTESDYTTALLRLPLNKQPIK